MASNEPQHPTQGDALAPTESEPLLGRPGDATQKPDAPMINNLFLGTAWLSQLGAVLLLAVIWSAVFTHPTLPLVSPHPLLQSLGIFTVLQAILLLQPTTTPRAKAQGQRAHFLLHLLSFSLFIAGTTIIEVNKHANNMAHFHSAHAYLGVTTVALLVVQYLFGFTIWAVPVVWGGEEAAKGMWKYRMFSPLSL
jgi:cytochrome b-561